MPNVTCELRNNFAKSIEPLMKFITGELGQGPMPRYKLQQKNVPAEALRVARRAGMAKVVDAQADDSGLFARALPAGSQRFLGNVEDSLGRPARKRPADTVLTTAKNFRLRDVAGRGLGVQ